MPSSRRTAGIRFAQHKQKYRAPSEYMALFQHVYSDKNEIHWSALVAGVFIHARGPQA
jgi:hypothetical protein